MGLDFVDEEAEDAGDGRFDVVERGSGRLSLVARSRTQTHHVKWLMLVIAVLLPAGVAAGSLVHPLLPVFLLLFGGTSFSIVAAIDFTRVASAESISTVERSFEIAPATNEGSYRDAGTSSAAVIVDGREVPGPILDVRVLSEAIPRSGGKAIHRVYVVLPREVLTLESTYARAQAMRLASIVREALGMDGPVAGGGREVPTASGCLWSGLFYVLAVCLPLAGAPAAAYASDWRGQTAAAVALVAATIALEHLFAVPMRRAVREHIREHLGARVTAR